MANKHVSGSTGNALNAVPPQRDDLVVEELDGEAVLYDPQRGAVHRFNVATFFVFNACDGSRTLQDIALALEDRFSVTGEEALRVVTLAVEQLLKRDLLRTDLWDPGDTDPLGPQSATVAVDPSVEDHSANAATSASGRMPSAASEPPPLVASERPPSAAAPTCGLERSSTLPSGTSRSSPIAKGGKRGVERYSKTGSAPGLSRRQLLGRGVTRAVVVAPVISTFFATGAYASGPSFSAAFGVDGCKNTGYSCTVKADCCTLPGNKHDCKAGTCCVKDGGACSSDADCCPIHFCVGSVCVD